MKQLTIRPDLLGEFIMTLLDKGYMVSIDRGPIIDIVSIRIIKYEYEVPYYVVRTITCDQLNCMTKEDQKAWFDDFVEWAEVEFLNLRQEKKNGAINNIDASSSIG